MTNNPIAIYEECERTAHPNKIQQKRRAQNNLQLLPILVGTQAIINCAKSWEKKKQQQHDRLFLMRTPRTNHNLLLWLLLSYNFSSRFEN